MAMVTAEVVASNVFQWLTYHIGNPLDREAAEVRGHLFKIRLGHQLQASSLGQPLEGVQLLNQLKLVLCTLTTAGTQGLDPKLFLSSSKAFLWTNWFPNQVFIHKWLYSVPL